MSLGVESSLVSRTVKLTAVGCHHCEKSGFHCRVGIYEAMLIGPELRRMISEHDTADCMLQEATRLGMRTLHEEGLKLIQKGLTTVEEVLHVTSSNE